jgi:DNA-binding transcriptional MerR regulator
MKKTAQNHSPLKIGDVARQSGVGIETLRFYEGRGLIKPTARTESGYRLYDRSIFDRLSFIKKSQSVGFTLDEIARIVDEAQHGRRPCAEVRSLAAQRLAELDRKLAELQRYRDELQQTLDAWGREGEKEGLICGLIEGLQPGSLHPPQGNPVAARRQARRHS